MSILQRIELNFWHLFIPWIRESSTFRSVVPKIYPLISSTIFVQFFVPTTLIALFGLSIGLSIGILIP